MSKQALPPGSETITVTCRLCGDPVVVTIEQNEFTHILKRAAKSVVHDSCLKQHDQNELDRNIAREAQRKMDSWARLCPAIYQNSDISQLRGKHGTKLDHILNWQWGPKGLFIWGVSRTGKTRSMWLMLRKQFQSGKYIIGLSHSEFASRATKLEPDQNSRWQELLIGADILFIDDLGKGKLTTRDGGASQAEEVLFHVFDQRIGRGLPTCWTSEWDLADLKARFSAERADSLTARLAEFSLDIQLRK